MIAALPVGLLRTSGAPSVAVGATHHEGRDGCRAHRSCCRFAV